MLAEKVVSHTLFLAGSQICHVRTHPLGRKNEHIFVYIVLTSDGIELKPVAEDVKYMYATGCVHPVRNKNVFPHFFFENMNFPVYSRV